ncbi:hypothetical protein LTR95_013870 [Oleoguttula sp. CCFEE 5521]
MTKELPHIRPQHCESKQRDSLPPSSIVHDIIVKHLRRIKGHRLLAPGYADVSKHHKSGLHSGDLLAKEGTSG